VTRPRLLLLSRQGSASLPADIFTTLRRIADVQVVRCPSAPPADEARRLLATVEVLGATNVCLPTIDAELLDAAPRLRGIVLYATGYDHINVDFLAGRGVGLSVVPDYATTAVAEHTIGLTLALATRLHLANDRCRGIAPGSVSLRGFELSARTMGIVGLGRIGTRVAALARGIGMGVVGTDTDSAVAGRARLAGIRTTTLAELLTTADVLSVCAHRRYGQPPLIGAVEVAAMRPHALLVNAARSGLVDTRAVIAAIRAGRLRGYGVDDHLAEAETFADLAAEGRVLQTGHSAWWRDEVLERGARMWGERLIAAVRGTPRDVVLQPRLTAAECVLSA
jgi:phosphoglycerate dehydrogenase-like enzyme